MYLFHEQNLLNLLRQKGILQCQFLQKFYVLRQPVFRRICSAKQKQASGLSSPKESTPIKQLEVKQAVLDDEYIAEAISNQFYGEKDERLWSFLSNRKLNSEKLLNIKQVDEAGILQLLSNRGLLCSVTKVKAYAKDLVYEFYSNLDMRITNETSQYHRVYIRGSVLEFFPKKISEYLELPIDRLDEEEEPISDFDAVITEFTGNALKVWSQENFSAAKLTLKYSYLYKIATAMWTPTCNTSAVVKDQAELLFKIRTGKPVKLARRLLDNIVSHAEVQSTHGTLPFSSLICRVLLKQAKLRKVTDTLKALPSLKVTKRLTGGYHINDIKGEKSATHLADVDVTTSDGHVPTSDFDRLKRASGSLDVLVLIGEVYEESVR